MSVTIGTTTYPSYQTVAGADAYLAADISRADEWEALEETAKARALVSATRLLAALPWCEAVPDPDADQAEPLPSVCAMLAADLAAKPALMADASGNNNLKSVKAGSTSVEYFSPVSGLPPIPKALWDLLDAAGLVCLNGTADMDATLDGAQPFGASDGCRPINGRPAWDWPIASEDYD